ncbi:MliC family protein [Roseobacter sp. S98]|uniref:MliC family protein n=1 Tax=Roseobacter algicola (ex Choi et al. 2025) (nom. illeg.) TaxID=3092138 RepID=UPI003F50DF66
MRSLAAVLAMAGSPLLAGTPVIYDCADAAMVVVIYDEKNRATVLLNDAHFNMTATVSASGAQYRARMGDVLAVWWSKGDQGLLIFEDAGGRELSRLAGRCVARPGAQP